MVSLDNINMMPSLIIADKNLGSCNFYRREMSTIPSPFESSGFVHNSSYISTEFPNFGTRFTTKRGTPRREMSESDRRLPVVHLAGQGEGWEEEEDLFQPDHNLEYLGQSVVSYQPYSCNELQLIF